jgi:hypothetical protein
MLDSIEERDCSAGPYKALFVGIAALVVAALALRLPGGTKPWAELERFARIRRNY